MQLTIAGQSFNGRDLVGLMHDREGEAGVDSPAVDVDGTGAALAVVTALLGAKQVEMLAQSIEHGGARIERQPVLLAVYVQHNWNGVPAPRPEVAPEPGPVEEPQEMRPKAGLR